MGIWSWKHGSGLQHTSLSSIRSGSSIKANRGHARQDPNEMILVSSLSSSSNNEVMLLWSPMGIRYSSISNCPNHSTLSPNRNRQDDSAAYCDDRSPTLSTLFGLLLQICEGHGTYVTSSGKKVGNHFEWCITTKCTRVVVQIKVVESNQFIVRYPFQ